MVSKNKRHARSQYQLQSAQAFVYPDAYAPVPIQGPVLEARPFVGIQVLHDKNASVVNLQLDKYGTYSFRSSGSSKREQGDVHDEVIGELIASARAYQSLARQLMSEATKRVNASTAAQEEARRRAQEKREAAKRPVKRRSKREWEDMQKRRAKEEAAKVAAEVANDLGGTVERIGDLHK
jgi:Domain of unknown function (DUF1876)